MGFSAFSHLTCSKCNRKYPAEVLINTCDCGYPLVVHYDLTAAANMTSPEEISLRPNNMWRYHELLPIRYPRNIVSLEEGFTPLLKLDKLGKELGFKNLYMK